VDTDGDGYQDSTEAGYPNAQVRRYPTAYSGGRTYEESACSPDFPDNCSGFLGSGQQTTTDGAGNYSYNTVGFDMDTIYFPLPSGYTRTTPGSVVVSTQLIEDPPGFNLRFNDELVWREADFGIRPNTVNITANVRIATGTGSCTATTGSPYAGANLNIAGGSTNRVQTTAANGATTFVVPSNPYTLTLQVPSGYDVVGRQIPSGGSQSGTNGMQFTPGANTTATFCIAINDPWLQTDLGDVRFRALDMPLPIGKYASTGNQSNQYPGIYYSSTTQAEIGGGNISVAGWIVNNEYLYNTDTQNRNGTVSYNFYKSRAKTEGVEIHPLTAGTLNPNEITESGVYEANGNLIINSYTHTNGNRVVILANGDVTINTPINIPVSQGLFIVAAKGNIIIPPTIGTTTLSSSTPNLVGYYSAEGSIVLPSAANCPSTPDRRLNVAGALIANSVKPFASNGTGSIQNQRTLCNENLNYPSIYVSSRLDFLTQLTDFYKVPFTKWREERP